MPGPTAAPRAGQLDLRDDVLGLRIRAQAPDRSRPARERRLLPALALNAPRAPSPTARGRAPVVGGWETQDGLVEMIFKALLPAFPDRLPAGTKGMIARPGSAASTSRGTTRASTTRSPAATAAARERRPRRGAGARPEHRERADRGDRAQLPGADRRALAGRGLGGPGRFRGGLGLRKDYRFDRTRPSPCSPTATARAPRAPSVVTAWAASPNTCSPRQRRDPARLEEDPRARPRRRGQRPDVRRRRLRPAGRARTGTGPT